nr:sulfite exporter TauE/SafE family protein [Kibdelosporangium sp. MJ126-NF4]
MDLLLVAATGLVAGVLNTIAGAGMLVSFPVFLALGMTPLQANVVNGIGAVPGTAASVVAFRRELGPQKPLLRKIMLPAAIGSLLGGILLFLVPEKVFSYLVPALLGLGALLVLVQPMVTKRLRSAKKQRGPLKSFIFGTSVYGGYFGTGIGVIFFAILGLFTTGTTHELNAVKVVLQVIAKGVAAVLFCFVAPVPWTQTAVFGAATMIAGPVGAYLSRKIPPDPLRYTIGVLGLVAAVKLAIA